MFVEQPLIAAANNSDSIDFAVPGSPTISRPRLPARPMMARSTRMSSPKNFRAIAGDLLPQMNERTAFGESFQPGGFADLSALARAASSSAYRISAGGRKTFSAELAMLFSVDEDCVIAASKLLKCSTNLASCSGEWYSPHRTDNGPSCELAESFAAKL